MRPLRHAMCLFACLPLLAVAVAVGPAHHAAAAGCSPPGSNFTNLNAVSFSDASDGIAVGTRNIAGYQPVVYQTTDGSTWSPLTPTCSDAGLNAVTTPDNAHAWIAGFLYDSGNNTKTPLILTSADGGSTWTPQSAPAGVGTLTGIHFLDDSTGWAVGVASGGGAVVIHTTDGGASWSALTAPAGLAGADGLALFDASHADVVGYIKGSSNWQPEFATTVDGGNSWTETPLGGPAAANVAMAISFVNASDGWVTGLNSHEAFIGRTTDGGATWSYAPDAPFARYFGVSFADATHGWVVGIDPSGDSSILASSDGGATWSAQVPPSHGHFTAVAALSPAHSVAVGQLGNFCLGFAPAIASTSDGGSTWVHQLYGQPPLPVGDLRAIAFSGAQGLSVGQTTCGDGSAVSSADGGQSWRSLSIPPDVQRKSGVDFLSDVAFPDPGHGWSVGGTPASRDFDTGIVLFTSDGGTTWTPQQLPSGVFGARLNAISFVDSLHGWVVGTVILASADGGQTWTQQTLPAGVTELHDVHFVSATQGWAVGVNHASGADTAVVITTVDGGATWTPQALPSGMTSAFGVDFASATTGWIVGNGANGSAGVIFSTINGGTLWTQQVTPTGAYNLADVSFSGTLDGWAVGTPTGGSPNGIILATTNGGATWTPQTAPGGAAVIEGVIAQSATAACVTGMGLPILNYGTVAALDCTTDGGASWHDVLVPNPPPAIPEAPVAALLVGVGSIIAAGAVRRRRRSAV